jgi:uncharacterized membrane-anchored protein YitT (DUF2179 family)
MTASSPTDVIAVPAVAGTSLRHARHEDLQALVSATLLVGLGVVLFGQSGLLTGGTAGLAFLLRYATGIDFGLAFFLVNLPFYGFAWRRLGPVFTLKTVAAVSLLSLFAQWLPHGISIDYLAPGTAAVLGGLLCGVGMLILFRHRASLGGVNVLVLFLQERFGWRAGTVQMAIDGLIVIAALWITDWQRVAWSVLGAVVLNLVLAINHRPGRYSAV